MAHIAYDRVVWKDIPWPEVLAGKRVASCYYMRSGLVRKDLLPLYAGDDAPKTHVLSCVDDLKTILKSSPPAQLWVLKKAAGSNASEIAFVSSSCTDAELDDLAAKRFGDAAAAAATAAPRWILQQYVIPATVRGRKFHIRVPVLAVGALSLFIHTNCRLISASKPWSLDDLADTFTHVTNLNVNVKHPGYSPWDQNFNIWALPKDVALKIWCVICRITAALFTRAFANRRHFFTLPNCYELFGLDFTVSRDGTASCVN